jgi:hypothetical protein
MATLLYSYGFVPWKGMLIKMKQHAVSAIKTNDKHKVMIVYALYFTSMAITASGVFFSIYSYLNQITFKVINTDVSGIIFGLVVMYLGVRYFLSVQKLRVQLYDPESKFSWGNFKKQKAAKSR